jgi:hypothetical protein
MEEFNKDIPPSSFRKWLKGYPFLKGQPEQRKRKLFTRDNSCLSLLEEVMVVFMERSNAKRGTSDVLWNQHALLSLAMSLRASLDKLAVGSLDEVNCHLQHFAHGIPRSRRASQVCLQMSRSPVRSCQALPITRCGDYR